MNDEAIPTVETHRIEIPRWHPMLLNKYMRLNRHTRPRIVNQHASMIGCYAVACGVPKAEGKRRVSLEVALRTAQRVEPDHDAWWKTTLDALALAGLLVDDGPKWCECGGVTYTRSGNEWGTTIVLEDLR